MSLNHLLRFFRRPSPELGPYEAYALWADSYPPEAHNPFMKLEQDAMLELLPNLNHKVVLDLACGSGRYSLKVQEYGASLTISMDFSPAMVSKAVTISDHLIQADIRFVPLASYSIDVIVCGLAVGHVRDLSSAIFEMARLLRPGGYVIYSDFHPFGKLAGWQRKFRARNGREYSVKHYYHLYSEHQKACHLSGLDIEEIREPLIPANHEWAGCPAALVIRARKT